MKKLVWFIWFWGVQYLSAQTFEELIKNGDEFYNERNYSEAAKIFSQAIQKDPKQAKGYWYRGDAYFNQREYSQAIQDYTQALQIEPKNWLFYKKRGDAYYNSDQFTLAEPDYTQAIGLETTRTQPVLWLYRGDTYKKLQKIDLACQDYQIAYTMGDKNAQSYAEELECAWAKSLPETPCPSGEAAISRVEVEPFTGAIIISKGLSIKELEVKPEDGVGYITAAEFGLDQPFVVKIKEPRGFCENHQQKAFFGGGFSLYDAEGKLLGSVADFYEKQTEGVETQYLKSLSMDLGFSKPSEVGKNYRVKMRFFDKRGNAELLIDMPVKLTAKTQMSSSIKSTVATLGLGIVSKSIETEVQSLDIQLVGKAEKFKPAQQTANQKYQLNLYNVKNLNPNADFTIRWVSEKTGEIAYEQKGKLSGNAQQMQVNYQTPNLAKGNYILWVKLQDQANQHWGASMPVRIE
ncbi:MAG: tetratricopeptide repeat protein [Microscillaceae bacterium]|jgi:tetratricopeptide (TPR) repeat protein|nr:tetratricopeptide repeat protein [Microscillaceae bacterium]